MKFEKYLPSEQLRPYVRQIVVSENDVESEYKIFPSPGLVIGFQYKGQLAIINKNLEKKLARSGITGISDNYKVFKNSANIGTILVYFTETGFTHFSAHPVNDLFDLSVSLDDIFKPDIIARVEEQLSSAKNDQHRIRIVDKFLQSQLKNVEADKLITEAVKLIYQSKGTIRIKDLKETLFISADPLEKRFRKIVGTTPKKFASIVRFHTVLNNFSKTKSLTEICYENNFFDQAHFIKQFRQFTGETPEHFKRSL